MAKEKGQNEKQRLQNIIQNTKDQETRTLREIEGELRYSERDNCVSSIVLWGICSEDDNTE